MPPCKASAVPNVTKVRGFELEVNWLVRVLIRQPVGELSLSAAFHLM